MPQLDKFTYFTQFFWLCLFFFTFYIFICNDGDGVLGISRILKQRNQLLSHRGNNIRSNDPNRLEDILRKGFSTGVSYMYFSLFEVSQWCNGVDLLGKRRKITWISCLGEISGKVLIVLFLTYLYHYLVKKGLVFMDGQGSLFSVVAPFLEDRGQGSVQPPTPSDTILLPVEEESREGPQSAPARLPPLIPEEERRMELEKELDRLVENAVIPSPSPSERDKLLRAQMELELKLEEALQKEGFSADSVYGYRNEWRRSAFTPDSRPGFISAKAIRNTLSKYQSDIRQSMSFRRLTKEIKMGVIPLSKRR